MNNVLIAKKQFLVAVGIAVAAIFVAIRKQPVRPLLGENVIKCFHSSEWLFLDPNNKLCEQLCQDTNRGLHTV